MPVTFSMKPLLLILVAALGCAGAPAKPDQYERGTLTRPPPAPHRPGVGAPTYDPHVQPPPPQPQPKLTPVPHTARTAREDTIWASDAPPEEWSNSMWEIVLPVPDPSHTEDKQHASRCGGTMRIAAKWAGVESVDSMPIDEKRCLASLLYAYCVSSDTEMPSDRVEHFKNVAEAFVRRSCTEDLRRRMIPVFGPIAAEWHALYIASRRGGQ